jgi:hypothetical protein
MLLNVTTPVSVDRWSSSSRERHDGTPRSTVRGQEDTPSHHQEVEVV